MGSLSPDSARAPGWLRPAWTPVKPPCHGLRCRRLVHPTRRLSTKVFLPTSPYPPSFQPPTYPTSFKRPQPIPYPIVFRAPSLPSVFPAPYLPHVFQATPTNSLPNRLSSPLPTRCLSRLHVFMNSGASQPTQVFHTSRTSPENPEE